MKQQKQQKKIKQEHKTSTTDESNSNKLPFEIHYNFQLVGNENPEGALDFVREL